MQNSSEEFPQVLNLRVFTYACGGVVVLTLLWAYAALTHHWGGRFVIALSIMFYTLVTCFFVHKRNRERQETWKRYEHEFLQAQQYLYRFIVAADDFALEQLTLESKNRERFERATSQMRKTALSLVRLDSRIESALKTYDPSMKQTLEYYCEQSKLIWHQLQHVKVNAGFWSNSTSYLLDEALAPVVEEVQEARARLDLLQPHIPHLASMYIAAHLEIVDESLRAMEQAADALQRAENRNKAHALREQIVRSLDGGNKSADAILKHLNLLNRVYVVKEKPADGTLATLPMRRTRLESSEYVRLRQGLHRINGTFAWMLPHPEYDFTQIDFEISRTALMVDRLHRWWKNFREYSFVEQMVWIMVMGVGAFMGILVLSIVNGPDDADNVEFGVSTIFCVLDVLVMLLLVRRFADSMVNQYVRSSIFRSVDRALTLLHEQLSEEMLHLDGSRLSSIENLQTLTSRGIISDGVLAGDKRQELYERSLALLWREALELKSLPRDDKDYRYIQRVEALDAQVTDVTALSK